jgi:hypothetical protein
MGQSDLSLMYSGNQKCHALEFLGTARDTLMFRYEGRPAELGVLLTWNWHDLRPDLGARGCHVVDFTS